MTDLDPCATKLAQLVAALTVEAERLEYEAARNRDNAHRQAADSFYWAVHHSTHHAQTQHAKWLREIIKGASA